jgi:hypothetical protein
MLVWHFVLNAHAMAEDRSDNKKKKKKKDLKQVFNDFPMYHVKILLGYTYSLQENSWFIYESLSAIFLFSLEFLWSYFE